MSDSRLAPLAMAGAARALALIDLNPNSGTYGCADRAYWHYRTLVDFPGASWQQVMLPLALLYAEKSEGNAWAGSPVLLDAVKATLSWWGNIQHRDGSFDEWYRNERSYCPTAFTLAAATQAAVVLGPELAMAERNGVGAACQRAAAWLESRRNPEVMNQNLAAAAGLLGTWKLTGDKRWLEAADALLGFVRQQQDPEGWLPEYGGPDFGYSALSLDLLAVASRMGSEQAGQIAGDLCRFLGNVARFPHGFPGRLGSRGTGHLFSYGMEHFAGSFPAMRALAARCRDSLVLHGDAAASDDRYFAYFSFPALATAYFWGSRIEGSPEPPRGYQACSHAGIAVWSGSGAVAVSLRRGGALAAQTPGNFPRYHLGYELLDRDGRRYSTAHWSTGPAPAMDEARITVVTSFREVQAGRPLDRWSFLFHFATRLISVLGASNAFQRLAKRMIGPGRKIDAVFRREIAINGSALSVTDTIETTDERAANCEIRLALAIPEHSPSARFDPAVALPAPLPRFQREGNVWRARVTFAVRLPG